MFDYTNNKSIVNTKLFVNNCIVDNMLSKPYGTYLFELESNDFNRESDRLNIDTQVVITNSHFSNIKSHDN